MATKKKRARFLEKPIRQSATFLAVEVPGNCQSDLTSDLFIVHKRCNLSGKWQSFFHERNKSVALGKKERKGKEGKGKKRRNVRGLGTKIGNKNINYII